MILSKLSKGLNDSPKPITLTRKGVKEFLDIEVIVFKSYKSAIHVDVRLKACPKDYFKPIYQGCALIIKEGLLELGFETMKIDFSYNNSKENG
tara:strand:- start:270 stop:548 length:279 start_codon:yes stop_codon:yes gene_type:complete